MLEAIDRAEHTIDLLTFVYWDGDIGTELRRAPGRAGPATACGCGCCSTPSAPAPIDHPLLDLMDEAGVAGALVPAAAPPAPDAVQPPHPPQGDDRRRGGRRSPAASASPTSGRATPATSTSGATPTSASRGPAVDGLRAAFLDNWTETDPVIFADERRPLPRPAQARRRPSCSACAARRSTGWGDVDTLFRTLLQLAEQRVRITTAYFVPDDELIERLCDARRPGRRGRRSCCPGPTPTSGSCSWPARAATPSSSTPASRSGTSSRRCCTPR